LRARFQTTNDPYTLFCLSHFVGNEGASLSAKRLRLVLRAQCWLGGAPLAARATSFESTRRHGAPNDLSRNRLIPVESDSVEELDSLTQRVASRAQSRRSPAFRRFPPRLSHARATGVGSAVGEDKGHNPYVESSKARLSQDQAPPPAVTPPPVGRTARNRFVIGQQSAIRRLCNSPRPRVRAVIARRARRS
jgi:hypothetical protein